MPAQNHRVNLWVCFLALLALTAAEVGLYEIWRVTHFIEKFALVLLILVFTVPKAAIVLIFFMHLKFEKLTIILLALAPFVVAIVGVLPMLTDIKTLKARQPMNLVEGLGRFRTHGHDHAPAETAETLPTTSPQAH